MEGCFSKHVIGSPVNALHTRQKYTKTSLIYRNQNKIWSNQPGLLETQNSFLSSSKYLLKSY